MGPDGNFEHHSCRASDVDQAYSQHDPQMALIGVLQRQRQRVDLISVQWRGQEEEDHREAETAKV